MAMLSIDGHDFDDDDDANAIDGHGFDDDDDDDDEGDDVEDDDDAVGGCAGEN